MKRIRSLCPVTVWLTSARIVRRFSSLLGETGKRERSHIGSPFSYILAGVFGLVFADPAGATHFRHGHLTWRPRTDISDTTVEFTLVNAFRRSGYAGTAIDGRPQVGDVITESVGGTLLFPGDGSVIGGFLGLQYRVTAYDPVGDWIIGVALDPNDPAPVASKRDRIQHEYPTATNNGSSWVAAIDSCCRISTLVNAPNGPYRVETLVDLTKGNGTFASPVSSLPPVVSCAVNAVCQFTVPAASPDLNVSVVRRLGGFAEDGGLSQPPGLTVDPINGNVSWDTNGLNVGSLWAVHVIVESYEIATGGFLTKVGIDFLIRIVPQGNPPVITATSDTTSICGSTQLARVGAALTFNISASDLDTGDQVRLNTAGLPVGATMNPSLPQIANPVSSAFSWTPTAANAGSHVVIFDATDSLGLQVLCPVTITVRAAPAAAVSFYVTEDRLVPLWEAGQFLANIDVALVVPQDWIVILHFFAPMRATPTRPCGGTAYGATLSHSRNCTSTDRIKRLVLEFAKGFYDSQSRNRNSHLRIVVGTNNSAGELTREHGAAWATMVNAIFEEIELLGWSGSIDVAGGIDAEVGWQESPDSTRNWVAGYASSAQWYLYNYGDASGCPTGGTTADEGNCITADNPNSEWTQADIHDISWKARPAWPLPQIYGPTHAKYWQQLRLYSYLQDSHAPMIISGVLAQRGACAQKPTDATCVAGADISPSSAWNHAFNALSSDPRTAQELLRWASDIQWMALGPRTNPNVTQQVSP